MRYGTSILMRFTPPIATKEELVTIHNAAIFLLANVGVGGVTRAQRITTLKHFSPLARARIKTD